MLKGDVSHLFRFLRFVPAERLNVHEELLSALFAEKHIHADGDSSKENAYQVLIEGVDGHVLRIIGRKSDSRGVGVIDHDLAVNFQYIPHEHIATFRAQWRPYFKDVKKSESNNAPLTLGLKQVGIAKAIALLSSFRERVVSGE